MPGNATKSRQTARPHPFIEQQVISWRGCIPIRGVSRIQGGSRPSQAPHYQAEGKLQPPCKGLSGLGSQPVIPTDRNLHVEILSSAAAWSSAPLVTASSSRDGGQERPTPSVERVALFGRDFGVPAPAAALLDVSFRGFGLRFSCSASKECTSHDTGTGGNPWRQ